MVVERAEGSYFWDDAGRRYLDFSSQLVFTNIGHQHPAVVAAIREQAERLCTVAPQHANDQRSEAARLIAELAPPGLEKVFFTNGGAEAIEHATRMARLHTGRHKVLAAYRSYHGATSTAINLTGDPRRWPSDTGSAGVVHFCGPFPYRSSFYSTTDEEECERALAHLQQVIAFEGPQTIAAIVLETVPGTAGVMPPPAGYLAGVRELCDRFGIVYIADEVMAGFGRTGRWFALDHWGVRPDLSPSPRASTRATSRWAASSISDEIAATFAERVFPGGLTYSGHPLACAAAVATITAMHEEGIVENADRIGREVLGPGLRQLADRHPVIGEVRGLGVFWALELVADRATREPLAPYGGTSPAMTDGVGLPVARTGALHQLQPAARRAALHDRRRGGQGGPRRPGRRAGDHRRALHRRLIPVRPAGRRRPVGDAQGDGEGDPVAQVERAAPGQVRDPAQAVAQRVRVHEQGAGHGDDRAAAVQVGPERRGELGAGGAVVGHQRREQLPDEGAEPVAGQLVEQGVERGQLAGVDRPAAAHGEVERRDRLADRRRHPARVRGLADAAGETVLRRHPPQRRRVVGEHDQPAVDGGAGQVGELHPQARGRRRLPRRRGQA